MHTSTGSLISVRRTTLDAKGTLVNLLMAVIFMRKSLSFCSTLTSQQSHPFSIKLTGGEISLPPGPVYKTSHDPVAVISLLSAKRCSTTEHLVASCKVSELSN